MISRKLSVGLALSTVLAIGVNAQPVSAKHLATTKKLVADVVDRLAQTKGGFAGYAVAMVSEGQPDFFKMVGVANAQTGAPVTASTAFYVASMTKSYTGVLAARLDREGVLPLSATLAGVWPEVVLPQPLDASKLTFDQMLSHRSGFENPPLSERTSYTDEVPPSAYPRLLTTASRATGLDFQYTNLGYLMYSAALQERTGRDWKALLGELVLQPFGLTQTYTRSSLVPQADLAWGHRWDGSKWLVVEPKHDAVMHAAGGMFVSSRDAARWMRVQLSDGKGVAGFVRADFELTRKKLAVEDSEHAGIRCDGYALGWHLCTFMNESVLYHGGVYDGVRTHMFLLPKQRAGFALLANSESQTGFLGHAFGAAIIASVTGADAEAAKRVQAIEKDYPARVQKQADALRATAAKSEAEPRWRGWTWKPDAVALLRYQGLYHSDLWGDVEVRPSGTGLVAWMGTMRRALRPAAPDLFAIRLDALEEFQPVSFTETTVTIGDRVFTKLAPR
jgi:CubicO group peptidase (beta-lactamase class C family)